MRTLKICNLKAEPINGRRKFQGKQTSVHVPGKGWQKKNGVVKRVPLSLYEEVFIEIENESYETYMSFGSHCIPHPAKAAKGGEDAHYTAAKYSSSNAKVYSLSMGVADGVSGWAADGIDPALYSSQLCTYGNVAANSDIFEGDPYKILKYAHENALAKGSSTMTIVNIDAKEKVDEEGMQQISRGHSQATLTSCNVGDSAFKVIRNGRIIYTSMLMEHYFNCPLQLGNPIEVPGSDQPDVADMHEMQLFRGDIIVLATDGVFDNLYDSDIISICNPSGKRDLDAQQMATDIAKLASEKASDSSYISPFSKRANDYEKKRQGSGTILDFFSSSGFVGGKVDDITCVVAALT